MASLISASTRRGVLSELNVNSPLGTASGPKASKQAGSAEKPSLLGETSLQKSLRGLDMVSAAYQEAGYVGRKRRDNGLDEAVQRSTKKFKAEIGQGPRRIPDGRVSGIPRGHVGGSISGKVMHSRSSSTPIRSHVGSAQTSSPASLSPSSSSVFSETALNDTQITETDESRVISTLTQVELREKARAIRLRLRLATYKVRTNQIDLPISRLQIKTTKFDLERLPTPRTKVTKPQRRTPLPSAPTSNIPNIRLQKPTSEKQCRTDIISSSPPPMLRTAASPPPENFEGESPTKEGEEETREELATPLLPCHRKGLLNPPNLGNPNSPGNDLTSSVVKRGTANVLLSLMLHR